MAELTPEEQIKLLQKLREEREELLELEKRGLDYDKERLAELNKQFESEKRRHKLLQEQIPLAQQYLEATKAAGKSADARLLQLEAAISLEEKIIQQEANRISNQKEISEADLKHIQDLEKQLDAKKYARDTQNEINQQINTTNELSLKTEKIIMKTALASKDMGTSLRVAGSAMMGLAQTGIDWFMGNLVSNAKEIFFSFNEATTAFEKQFAVGQDYKDQITDIYLEMNQYGVSIEDVTKAQGDLITNFTDFTLATEKQRKELTETATLLERGYGIAFEDFAKGVQTSTKALGMSTAQAKDFQSELAETAKAIGVPASQLSAQFASMGPSLAKFGSEGSKAFKEVARLSKLTGLEMEKVIAVTEQFDTFEGAAERAGMLNAALGGNFVNAMDLMMATDPAERFMMIRDAIDQTGLSFDEMGYYQKQFFAEAAGLDNVNDLALLMSGNMDLLAGSTNQSSASIEEQAKRAADMTTIMETLKAAFVDLVGPIVLAEGGIKKLADSFRENVVFVGKLVAAFKLLQIGMGAIMAIRKLRAMNAVISLANGTKEIAQTNAQTGSLEAQNTVLQRNIQLKQQSAAAGGGGAGAGGIASAFGTAATIAAVAVALLALGKSFKLIAEGVALIANSFKELETEKISGLNDTLLIMSGTMVLMGAGLVALGMSASVAAGPMLAFGAAVFMIGAGIGIAAGGMSMLVDSFASLAEVEGGLMNFAGGIIALAAAFVILAAAVSAFGNPLATIGVVTIAGLGLAAAGIGKLIGFFKKDKNNMEDMSVVFDKFSGVSVEQLKAGQKVFEGIKNSINDTKSGNLRAYGRMAMFGGMVSAIAPGFIATKIMMPGGSEPKATPGTAGTAGQPQKLAAPSDGKLGEIKLTFDSDLFKDKVIEIHNTQSGLKAIDGMEGRGG